MLSPVLAIGVTTVINQSVLNDKPISMRVLIATGTAGVFLSLAENAVGNAVVTLAWIAFVTTLFTKLDSSIPSPIESAQRVWENSK